MIKLISDAKEFDCVWLKVLHSVNNALDLPDQLFNPQLKHFRFAEYGYVASGDAWADLSALCKGVSCNEMHVGTISPTPSKVHEFFPHWNWWNINAMATQDDYWAMLTADPGDSEADALRYSATKIFWLAGNEKFAIYGDYDRECAVLACSTASPLALLSDAWVSTPDQLPKYTPETTALYLAMDQTFKQV
jgi:hypothetical protein